MRGAAAKATKPQRTDGRTRTDDCHQSPQRCRVGSAGAMHTVCIGKEEKDADAHGRLWVYGLYDPLCGPALWVYEMHPSLWVQVRYGKEETVIKLLQPRIEVMLQHVQSEQMIGLNFSSFVSHIDIVVFVSIF